MPATPVGESASDRRDPGAYGGPWDCAPERPADVCADAVEDFVISAEPTSLEAGYDKQPSQH
jgi:hypothetical protein